jgi:hypothetical protein
VQQRLAPAPGHRNPDRQADADATRPTGPKARGRPTRAVAEAGAAPTGDAAAAASGGAAAPRPPAEKRSAANGGRRRVASAGDGTLDRAAHAFGLADEREATLALSRALRVFGFALVGVATGMAVMSLFFRRRH